MEKRVEIQDVENAQKGDKQAYEIIIMAVIDSLYRVAYGILQNEEDASDAISNATLKAYEKITTLKNQEYFKTWITRILINECNSMIKQKQKIIYIDQYEEKQNPIYQKDNEITIDVKEAIEKLDEKLKQTVILYYFEDLGIEEISSILEIPKGTVKSRLSRAREILSKQLINCYKDIV